jgi:hypothetical protein
MSWGEHRSEVRAYEARREAGWIETEAVFTSCKDTDPYGRSPNLRYRWEGEWKDKEGTTHRTSGGSSTCAPGQRLTILADPANPQEYTRPPAAFMPVPLVLCVIGLGFGFIAVAWLKSRRAARAPTPSALHP